MATLKQARYAGDIHQFIAEHDATDERFIHFNSRANAAEHFFTASPTAARVMLKISLWREITSRLLPTGEPFATGLSPVALHKL